MIRVRDLHLTYRADGATHQALKGVSLEIPRGALLTLLGPSGCGKTTLLRSIAGLETPDAGEIRIDQDIVFSAAQNTDIPPARRNHGMVFQSYAIWPHMSVYENAVFPLRYRGAGKGKNLRARVMECLALVRLDGLADRPAPMLSGGQQQRLALARALAAEPKLLLLDEPLSNLDARLREDMRFELRQIIQRSGVTTIFVTHEQSEALSLSDLVAVMNQGTIVQVAEPRQLYRHPQTEFVASFLVRANLLPAQVLSAANGHCEVDSPLGRLECLAAAPLSPGAAVTIVLKPETVGLTPCAGAHARIEAIAFMGDATEYAVRIDDHLVVAKLAGESKLAVGDTVNLDITAHQNAAFASR
jgi:iron(III) transport system ATP-binding protein